MVMLMWKAELRIGIKVVKYGDIIVPAIVHTDFCAGYVIIFTGFQFIRLSNIKKLVILTDARN
jgi:hypothetical protein